MARGVQLEFLLSGIKDTTDTVLASGTVTFYIAGDTTLKSVYTDYTLATAADNPITLNSSGAYATPLYASGAYKVVVKNSAGTTIYTWDNQQYFIDNYPSGTWADPTDYGDGSKNSTNIELLKTALGTTNKYKLLLKQGVWTISADLTITSNFELCPVAGADVQIASGKTLTINGGIDAGDYQWINIAAGTGVVVYGTTNERLVRPEWHGAKGDGSTDDHAVFEKVNTALSNTGGIIVSKNYSIQDDVTLAATTYLKVMPGGKLTVSASKTFTIPVLAILPERFQWIAGSGLVDIQKCSNKFAEWWGGTFGNTLTAVGMTAAATEQTLQTINVSKHLLTYNNQGVRIVAWGNTDNNDNTKTIKLYLNGTGGTVLVSVGGTTTTNNKYWRLETAVYRKANAEQRHESILFMGTAILTQTNSDPTLNLLTTGDFTIVITGTSGQETANADDIVCDGIYMEFIPT